MRHLSIAVIAIALTAGCSRPADSPRPAPNPPAAPAPQPIPPGQSGGGGPQPGPPGAAPVPIPVRQGADQVAQGIQQMAQGLAQMAQSNGDAVKPVEFQQLMAALPAVGGWTRADPEGRQIAFPFPISKAQARYTKGDMAVDVTVTDSAFNQVIMAPVSMVFTSGYSEKTANGYKKSTVISGSPALEEWDTSEKHGTLTVIVNKRFIVEGKGTGLDNVDTLRTLVSKVDVAKLK